MPQVGDKHFPYTKAGYKAAATAKKKMDHTDYRKGGLFARGGLKKDQLKKFFPDSKRDARRSKYKLKAKKLLSAMT